MRHARAAGTLYRECDAEIGDNGRTILQENILRLDVAVNDPLLVRMFECARDFARDAQRVVDRQLPFALKACPQGLAAHIRHDVIQQSIGRARIEQRQNVRMLQFRRRLDLAQEPLGAECRAEIRMQDLDGDIAFVLEIVREENSGHTAGAKFAVDAVAVGECAGEA